MVEVLVTRVFFLKGMELLSLHGGHDPLYASFS